MEDAVRIGLFLGAGFLLLSAVLWAGNALFATILGDPRPNVLRLAPVEVISGVAPAADTENSAPPPGTADVALARLFLARVQFVQNRVDDVRAGLADVVKFLDEQRRDASATVTDDADDLEEPVDSAPSSPNRADSARSPATGAGARGGTSPGAELPGLASDVFELPKIALTIGGVDVGPLLTRMMSWAFTPKLDRIVIDRSTAATTGTRVSIAGPGVPRRAVVIDKLLADQGTEAAALDRLAYALALRAFEVGANDLEPSAFPNEQEFSRFLEAMFDLQRLVALGRMGATVDPELEKVFETLSDLSDKVHWHRLHVITAVVAQNLGRNSIAVSLFDRALRHLKVKQAPAAEIESLARRLEAARRNADVEAASHLVRQRRIAGIASMIGLPRPTSGTPGVAPAAGQSVPGLVVVGCETPSTPPWMQRYTADVLGTVRAFTPNALIDVVGAEVFSAGARRSQEPWRRAMDAAFASEHRVILWTYSPITKELAERLAELTTAYPSKVFVLASGNRHREDLKALLDALPENVFVVSALDYVAIDARPDAQTSGVTIWVPGVSVPTTARLWTGAGPAAAVFASGILQVLANNPQMTVAEIREGIASPPLPSGRVRVNFAGLLANRAGDEEDDTPPAPTPGQTTPTSPAPPPPQGGSGGGGTAPGSDEGGS